MRQGDTAARAETSHRAGQLPHHDPAKQLLDADGVRTRRGSPNCAAGTRD